MPYGQYIFLNGSGITLSLLSHEYIHVLQYEGRGYDLVGAYIDWASIRGYGPRNPEESTGYLWEAWTKNLGAWGYEPWQIWKRPQ